MIDDFEDKLSALFSHELALSRRDPKRLANMIESLISAMAMTIAVGSGGDEKLISNVLEATSIELIERAAEKAPLGKYLAGLN